MAITEQFHNCSLSQAVLSPLCVSLGSYLSCFSGCPPPHLSELTPMPSESPHLCPPNIPPPRALLTRSLTIIIILRARGTLPSPLMSKMLRFFFLFLHLPLSGSVSFSRDQGLGPVRGCHSLGLLQERLLAKKAAAPAFQGVEKSEQG